MAMAPSSENEQQKKKGEKIFFLKIWRLMKNRTEL